MLDRLSALQRSPQLAPRQALPLAAQDYLSYQLLRRSLMADALEPPAPSQPALGVETASGAVDCAAEVAGFEQVIEQRGLQLSLGDPVHGQSSALRLALASHSEGAPDATTPCDAQDDALFEDLFGRQSLLRLEPAPRPGHSLRTGQSRASILALEAYRASLRLDRPLEGTRQAPGLLQLAHH